MACARAPAFGSSTSPRPWAPSSSTATARRSPSVCRRPPRSSSPRRGSHPPSHWKVRAASANNPGTRLDRDPGGILGADNWRTGGGRPAPPLEATVMALVGGGDPRADNAGRHDGRRQPAGNKKTYRPPPANLEHVG